MSSKPTYADGACEWCKHNGRVYALKDVPGPRLCINCSHHALRARGLDDESAHLPPGFVQGICWTCGTGKPVSIAEGRPWMCSECAAALQRRSAVTVVIAVCPGCAFNGPLFAERAGEIARCVNCAYLHVRQTGGAPEWNHLPAGHVIGDCRRCNEENVAVSLVDGKTWICVVCEAATVLAEGDDLIRIIVDDE